MQQIDDRHPRRARYGPMVVALSIVLLAFDAAPVAAAVSVPPPVSARQPGPASTHWGPTAFPSASCQSWATASTPVVEWSRFPGAICLSWITEPGH